MTSLFRYDYECSSDWQSLGLQLFLIDTRHMTFSFAHYCGTMKQYQESFRGLDFNSINSYNSELLYYQQCSKFRSAATRQNISY